jgi:endoglucanase
VNNFIKFRNNLYLIELFLLLTACVGAPKGGEKPRGFVSPVEKYGKIRIAEVNGRRRLCTENGDPVQLKGMSTMGLQWESWILTEEAFDALAYDWRCDVVRIAMYVTEGGYKNDPFGMLAKVEKGIKLASDRGLYVIVDWHVLTPGDPNANDYLNAGKSLSQYSEIRKDHPEYGGPELFFAYLSQKYGDLPNILWETANEPNKLSKNWSESLLPYHQKILNAVRLYDKDGLGDNIVICGTDSWSQEVDAPIGNEVADPKRQVMYTAHFYAGTHGQWLMDRVKKALDGGLAVFCTEWGTSEADGGQNGKVYIAESENWLDFFDANGVSWCNWSLARAAQSSAAFKPNAASFPKDLDKDGVPSWKDSDLSASGLYVRGKIREK